MKKIKIVGAILAAGTLLGACSGTGSDSGTADTASKDYTYAVITHGAPGDAFWDRVKSGAEQAGKDYGVKVNYASDADPAKQSQLIDGAVADKVDGIVVSMANPDGVEASVKKAVAAGVPVITINSGVDQFKDFGAITHIGQTETIAGQAVGEKLKEAGSKNAICVIQEAGNVGLEERCKAVAETMGGTVENLQVDGTDDNAVQATITSKLQSNTDIDTVVTLGGQYAIDAVAAVKDSGSSAKVATFDLSEDVIKDIQAGTILFAVDQQPYVQGFLGVTGLYLKSINGNDIGGGQPINSGPAFITKENADAVLKFASNGTR
ncbi:MULTISPECIES: sugar ABC transporter substrate-binding protein [Aeromicrobium]|uniref:sugar ABC transporter substrate-binding protein n=1 Tax=Aeromicrobium TaxID=2040 RepID=UPI000701D6EC|nr:MULTISPECIES: sugar ABC transporter substrate-binding protein [Aeromicrobium]KQX72604.1 sugar ABC transporter substrate-binding protein [Aeromicrobium sp. Root472D3]MBD8607648.1 sugar ABC transporter substrate-binding protein [Aeromicrobium sp. CFBP 8757]MCL8252246.1 sugar ABC transporter substrate-binding protein [Aeromicrobium fastidiosum]